jgi:6-phosphofructokinase 1
MTKGLNAVIAQGGGPTAVINQTLVGCALALRESGRVGGILGARHGVRGITRDDYVDLATLPMPKLDRVAVTPSAALGSTRDKPDAEYCQRIVEGLKQRDVRILFYIGGNDSADTCRIVNETAARGGYDLRSFHLPKTIDNDLMENDHTPGYGSAARWVAMAFMSDNLDNRALPGIKIDVVMGRNAGFLTAAGALGRKREDDGPHLIYLPERTFDADEFVNNVAEVNSRLGRCLVAVSEGVKGRDGQPVMAQLGAAKEKDAHGNLALSGTGALGDALAERIRQELGKGGKKVRVRADTFGYIQRSSFDVSPVDSSEARAVGAFAAALALKEADSSSITIQRESNNPYRVSFASAAFDRVAAKTRVMPREFMHADRPDVTDEFILYATPLVGELPVVEPL